MPRPTRYALRVREVMPGPLNAHPCAFNELARIVRATFQAFSSCPRRGKRGPKIKSRIKSDGM
jgi:hypothetical protein